MSLIEQRGEAENGLIYARGQWEGMEHRGARVFDPETADLAGDTEGLPTFLYKFAVRSEMHCIQRAAMNQLP
eukprot:3212533-Pyramimonas_sp.AAC.1